MNFDLGGVTINITSAPIMLPAQPNTQDPAVNWTTSQLTIGTMVRMVNGALWRVLTLGEDAPNPRIALSLGVPGRPTRLSLTVELVDADSPIWQSNIPAPIPEPDPEEPPVIVPDVPPPPDNPATPGDPPQEPVEPETPPVP